MSQLGKDVPPGALISFLQKGLQYLGIEESLHANATEDADGAVNSNNNSSTQQQQQQQQREQMNRITSLLCPSTVQAMNGNSSSNGDNGLSSISLSAAKLKSVIKDTTSRKVREEASGSTHGKKRARTTNNHDNVSAADADGDMSMTNANAMANVKKKQQAAASSSSSTNASSTPNANSALTLSPSSMRNHKVQSQSGATTTTANNNSRNHHNRGSSGSAANSVNVNVSAGEAAAAFALTGVAGTNKNGKGSSSSNIPSQQQVNNSNGNIFAPQHAPLSLNSKKHNTTAEVSPSVVIPAATEISSTTPGGGEKENATNSHHTFASAKTKNAPNFKGSTPDTNHNGGLNSSSNSMEIDDAVNDTETDTPPSEILTLKMHTSEVFMCAWNPIHTHLIATGSGDATARIWSMHGAKASDDVHVDHVSRTSILLEHGPAGQPNKDVTTLEWSSSGELLATGSYDGVARVWRRTGELIHLLTCHRGPIFSLKWNKSGNYLLSGSYDKTTIVWEVNNERGVVRQQFSFHQAPALDVDWKNDYTFASCSTDKSVHICQVGSYEPLRTYRGHTDEVNAVKWDPSGTLLASCSDDCTAKVWNVADSTTDGPLHDFQSHQQEIYTVKWWVLIIPCYLI